MNTYKRLLIILAVGAASGCGSASWGGEYYSNPSQGNGRGCFLYMSNFTIAGYPVEEGDEIGAYHNGTLKGSFTSWADGVFHSSMIFGAEGDEIQFRIVDKSRKREFIISNTYTLQSVSMQGYPSVAFVPIIGPEVDTDGDGMCDYWESFYGLDSNSAEGINGATGDSDDDGVSNIEEYEAGSNPVSKDTDGDMFKDLLEIAVGTDPDDPSSIPASIRINFGPGYYAEPPGYAPDSGQHSFSGYGYGWR